MRMRRHHHLPGHYIVYEGDEVNTLHLVKRGKIEIIVDGNYKGRIGEFVSKRTHSQTLNVLTCQGSYFVHYACLDIYDVRAYMA